MAVCMRVGSLPDVIYTNLDEAISFELGALGGSIAGYVISNHASMIAFKDMLDQAIGFLSTFETPGLTAEINALKLLSENLRLCTITAGISICTSLIFIAHAILDKKDPYYIKDVKNKVEWVAHKLGINNKTVIFIASFIGNILQGVAMGSATPLLAIGLNSSALALLCAIPGVVKIAQTFISMDYLRK